MKKICKTAHRAALSAIKPRVRNLRKHVRAAAEHDVDGIHDLRVASRRLRAALEDHRPLFRKRLLKRFRRRVRDVTRGLGKARELDVTLGLLRKWKRRAPLRLRKAILTVQRVLREQRDEQSASVDHSCALVRDPNYRHHAAELIASLKTPKECYVDLASFRLAKRYRQLTEAHDAWAQSGTDDDLHAVRVAFKKLRYSCEVFGPLYGPPMEEFIEHMKSAQEALGTWNDERVLRDYVAAAASTRPEPASELNLLVERVDKAVARHLARYAALSERLFSKRSRDNAHKLFHQPTVVCCAAKKDAE